MSDCCPPQPPSDHKDHDALRRSFLKLGDSPAPASSGLPSLAPLKPAATRQPATPSCCGSATTGESSCCGSGKKGRPDFLLWGSLTLFLAGIASHLLWSGAPAWLNVFGHTCHELFGRSWWGLLAGVIAVAVIGRVPRELVSAILGRGGSTHGLFRAVGAGLVLDLCNHGILMVGMGLYKRGASLGQTIAFLIASPWNSLSLTLILAALIGWKWMLIFIALSAVIALITGWLADRLVDAGKIPANPNTVDLPDGYRILPAARGVVRSLKPGRENYANLAREAWSGSTMILRWIFFGFVLTGAIRAFVPIDIFQQYFGPSLVGLLLTLLATTVIEVCSEGSSPVAADLLTRAHAPGNAFTFLMAGAATDYTEMLALRETTRSWKATFALPLLSTPQVILIGWLINHYGS